MLRIKENDKPPLSVCQMVCDGGINEKLNQYELTKFLNCHSCNLVVGRPGSGKTSMLYSFFKSPKILRKCYHTIYLFQPSHSRGSMKDPLFDKLPDEQKFDELTYGSLASVLDQIRAAPPSENKCIIFDDMTAYLKSNDTLQLFKELVFNRRHLRVSIYFLVQTWYSVPRDIRKCFTNLFVFRVSKSELQTIFDEVVEQRKEMVVPISQLVWDKPHQFLFINTDSNRLFKGFDEIVFSQGDL